MAKKTSPAKTVRAGFTLPELSALKKEIAKRPELEKKLKKDFRKTLQAEGIVLDDAFRERFHTAWQERIKEDVQRVVEKKHHPKRWYLTRVIEEKPITIHVKINKKSGEKTKTLKGDA